MRGVGRESADEGAPRLAPGRETQAAVGRDAERYGWRSEVSVTRASPLGSVRCSAVSGCGRPAAARVVCPGLAAGVKSALGGGAAADLSGLRTFVHGSLILVDHNGEEVPGTSDVDSSQKKRLFRSLSQNFQSWTFE